MSLPLGFQQGSLRRRQRAAAARWKQCSRAVRCTVGRSFLSFCQQMLDKSCTVAQPCGRNLSIVRSGGLYKQKVQSLFSVQTETLLLAHTCGFLRGVGEGREGGREGVACLQIIFNNTALRMRKEGLRSKMIVLTRGV